MSFECVECGYDASKWMGKCPRCNEWDTMVEVSVFEKKDSRIEVVAGGMENLSEIRSSGLKRIQSTIKGIDRILGGGVVPGEVILLGGPPGVGKSTLFLQLADKFAGKGKKVLFVSGEESPAQIKVHADRLKVTGENIAVISSGDLREVEKAAEENVPDIIFIDSIQAVMDPEFPGVPGSLTQVKMSGQKLTAMAKNTGSVIFISGQITKQGSIAGPKVLEHIVDAVIYLDALEGDRRILGAAKNRFGSCGDFVLFNLTGYGLEEAENTEGTPGREKKSIEGQASSCVRIGSRLVAIELQALVAGSYFEYPLRRTSGFSRERLLMLSAIAERYLGLNLGSKDIYMNVSGGNKVSERAADLGAISVVLSSIRKTPISTDTMFLGEVGLSGEVRSLKDIGERLKFASTSSFKRVILSGYGKKISNPGIKLEYIKTVKELGNVL